MLNKHTVAMVRILIYSDIYALYQPHQGKVLDERMLLRCLAYMTDSMCLILPTLAPPPHIYALLGVGGSHRRDRTRKPSASGWGGAGRDWRGGRVEGAI